MFRFKRSLMLILLSLTGPGLYAQEISVMPSQPPRFGDRREWVIEEVTQPKDGSFGNVQIGRKGDLYWTNFRSEGESAFIDGLYKNGRMVPGYEGLHVARMDYRAGHLCTAIYNRGEDEQFWYSIEIDGREVGRPIYNVNLPVFDRNRRDYLWVYQENPNMRDVVFSDGSRTPVLDFVPEDGYWYPYSSYQVWPVGYVDGKTYLYASQYQWNEEGDYVSHVEIVDGSTKRSLDFSPIVDIDRATMGGEFVLVTGEDSSGARRMVLLNVRTGRSLEVKFPSEGMSDPTILQVNEVGQIFYSEMSNQNGKGGLSRRPSHEVLTEVFMNGDPAKPNRAGGNLKFEKISTSVASDSILVYIGNGRDWMKPIVINLNDYDPGNLMWPQEWAGNQVVWAGARAGQTNWQIMRATYKMTHRRDK